MALLNRSPRGDGRFTRRRTATREESEAVVREKLDLLARRLVAEIDRDALSEGRAVTRPLAMAALERLGAHGA